MKTLEQPTMELSDRINSLKPSTTLGVAARVKELKAEGVDVIGFGAGEPDFTTPGNIIETAIEALREGKTHYAPVPGEPQARAAIARKLKSENGIACVASDIVISTGAKQSIYLALQCLLDPGKGQEVIVPTPAWVSYFPMVSLAGGTVIEVPGAVDNDFRMTPEQLEQAITPRTRVMMINNPSNPCGTMYPPDEMKALGEILAKHERITIISDEIYEKLVYGDCSSFSLGAMDSLAGRVITINGMSKAYAMTGWRIGYACSPSPDGNESPMARAMAKLQSQMTSCITSFCYQAIIEALENSAEAVESMRQTFGQRGELMHGLLSAMPGLICPKPTGAFYVFPDISAYFGKSTSGGQKIDSALTFAEALLEEAKVAVVPGNDFGEAGKNHVRLSFACSDENITEGCCRMGKWLETLS